MERNLKLLFYIIFSLCLSSCLHRKVGEEPEIGDPNASKLFSVNVDAENKNKICAFASTSTNNFWSKNCKEEGVNRTKGPIVRVRVFINCKERGSDYIYHDIFSWYRCLNDIEHPSNGNPKHSIEYGCYENKKGHCEINPEKDGKYILAVQPNSPQGLLLRNIYQRIEQVRSHVLNEAGAGLSDRLMLVNTAEFFTDIANEAFLSDDDIYAIDNINLATKLLDTAIDFTPGISIVKDAAILLLGVNPITGEKVSGLARAMTLALLLVPTAITGTLKTLSKTAKILKAVAKTSKRSKSISQRLLKSLKDSDNALRVSTTKVPCLSLYRKKDRSLFLDLLDFFSPIQTAYADNPCAQIGEITDDVLSSAGDIGFATAKGVKGYTKTLQLSGLNLLHAKKAVSKAKESYKGQTRLSHALHKHQGTKAGRKPQLWGEKLKGSMNTWHEQAMKHFRDIFTGPGIFNKVKDSKSGIEWLEKRLPDGRGLRLQLDGSFKGFID